MKIYGFVYEHRCHLKLKLWFTKTIRCYKFKGIRFSMIHQKQSHTHKINKFSNPDQEFTQK